PERTILGSRIYVSPIVVHFASVLLVSALSLVPEISPPGLGALLLVPAALGLAYVALVVWRFFGPLPTRLHWSDPLFYAAFPALGYFLLAVAAAAFIVEASFAPIALAAGTL